MKSIRVTKTGTYDTTLTDAAGKETYGKITLSKGDVHEADQGFDGFGEVDLRLPRQALKPNRLTVHKVPAGSFEWLKDN